MTERPIARHVKPGEMLALDPSKLHRGPQGFFWLFSDPPKPNERKGDVAVMYVRGELEHHASWGESYEGILTKFEAAITGQDACEAHEREHKYDEDYEAMSAAPPACVVTVIDSPGGVVAGLNATVRKLQEMRAAHPEIRFVVYVDEMAASAAYALACGLGDEIVCPRDSAIIGSIGVISTMVSQARKNEKDGYDVVLLTSGARKADGHAHAPLSDKAKEVEQGRVNKLAMAFFNLASKARGIPIAKIQGFEAGIFLSKDAKTRGLVDAIMSWDDLLIGASKEEVQHAQDAAGGNQTDRRLRTSSKERRHTRAVTLTVTPTEQAMPIDLDALIKKALSSEKDRKKLLALAANLDAYKKTKHTIEKHESEEGDEDEDEDDDKDGDSDDDDEGDDKEEKKSSKSEEEEKASASADKDDEDDDEEEEEEAKAALSLVRSLTGKTGKEARGALAAIAGMATQTAKDVAEMKKAHRATERSSLIASLKGKINKSEAKWLESQDLPTLRSFTKMRLRSGYVNTETDELIKPKHVNPDSEEALSEERRRMIASAVAAMPGDQKFKESLKAELVKAHLAEQKNERPVLNGAGRV